MTIPIGVAIGLACGLVGWCFGAAAGVALGFKIADHTTKRCMKIVHKAADDAIDTVSREACRTIARLRDTNI